MTALRFILLGYAFLGFFVAGGVFFKKGGRANFTLTCFILLLSFEVTYFLYSTSALFEQYQLLIGALYFPIGFVYGPLLLLHFIYLTEKDQTYKWWHFVQFIFAVLMLIAIWDIAVMPFAERIAYIEANFLSRIMTYNYLRAGHQLLYGLLLIYLFAKKRYVLPANQKLYLLLMTAMYLLSTVLISWLTLFADNWRQFIYFYLLIYTVVFVIAFLLYTDAQFLQKLTQKYLSSRLSEQDMKRILHKIKASFEQQKTFLNKGLNLTTFSKIIEEKPHSISQTMSECVGKNFNDYLNTYRIEHAKKLLTDPANDHFKIEAIAMDAGFNNKVTFNKSFLKIVGVTPSKFKRVSSKVNK